MGSNNMDENFFLDIPDAALEALNFEQDGSQNHPIGFPEITDEDLSSVIPQEEMLKGRALKGAKKFPSEAAAVGSKGIKHTDFEQPCTSKSLIAQSPQPLKRGKKFPSEAAAVGSKGIKHTDFEQPCTSKSLIEQNQPALKKAKKSTSKTASVFRAGGKGLRPPAFEPPKATSTTFKNHGKRGEGGKAPRFQQTYASPTQSALKINNSVEGTMSRGGFEQGEEVNPQALGTRKSLATNNNLPVGLAASVAACNELFSVCSSLKRLIDKKFSKLILEVFQKQNFPEERVVLDQKIADTRALIEKVESALKGEGRG
ncbi:uncharacterized protein LOC115644080 isoform X1 [Gopherus evgoodei]|uniref:uncharacterized protein LOC115644080 isoform X1 n=1 Tax=Gopherus evgoodei TaxID=1825980 RepID=UPI0011CF011A|nr:uncharacterized protein LOC115644080 isoform X1 [Gopherus evgoodei]